MTLLLNLKKFNKKVKTFQKPVNNRNKLKHRKKIKINIYSNKYKVLLLKKKVYTMNSLKIGSNHPFYLTSINNKTNNRNNQINSNTLSIKKLNKYFYLMSQKNLNNYKNHNLSNNFPPINNSCNSNKINSYNKFKNRKIRINTKSSTNLNNTYNKMSS